jgi:membrane protease YdiL (CAAX protease family)
MKKCPYCGKEYPDEATICNIDAHPLFDPSKPPVEEPPQIKKEKPPKPEPAKDETGLVWPEYQWRARDAWKCIGIIFCLGFILMAVNHLIYLFLPSFYRSGYGFVTRDLLHYGAELLAVIYFARTETFKTFFHAFSLDQKPTNLAWFGMSIVLIIRLTSHYMYMHHWGNGVHNDDLSAFRHTIGYERFFFLIPLAFFAPIFEEPIYRGFLYKAFRGSLGVGVSMTLIIVWTCYTHWRYYSESWIAAVDLSVWTVIQCYLREKSRSLWDCVLCHFFFNVSGLFISHLFINQ